jgi:hypothetical protein
MMVVKIFQNLEYPSTIWPSIISIFDSAHQTASEAEPKWAESKIFLVIEGLFNYTQDTAQLADLFPLYKKRPLELARLGGWTTSVQWVRRGRESFDRYRQIAKSQKLEKTSPVLNFEEE